MNPLVSATWDSKFKTISSSPLHVISISINIFSTSVISILQISSPLIESVGGVPGQTVAQLDSSQLSAEQKYFVEAELFQPEA